MTESETPFFYRESVQVYFDSEEVRFAVGQLLARKMKYVPQTFSAGEVSDFYRACLAARQTQIDYALDMFDLWHRIWPTLGVDWQPAPYDPSDADLSLDPQIRWDEGYFQRDFRKPGTDISAHMWMFLSSKAPNGSEIELGCTLVNGSKSLLKKGSMPEGWSWDKDNEGFQFSADVAVAADGLDLTPFVEAAKRAASFIEGFVRR
jgi:hypothetical protein